MQAVIAILRVAVGVLLIVTGALKVGHPGSFAASIADFRLLSPALIRPLALFLPILEIGVGVYLVVGLFTRAAAIVAACQFALYAGVIASAILRGLPANCGCFGPADSAPADWPHVLFDLALTVIALLVAVFAPGVLALDLRLRKSDEP
ncbi:MAG: MauE/DoxX family redox-associated membrane protein [Vulcanimicrobiaceae bacterium]